MQPQQQPQLQPQLQQQQLQQQPQLQQMWYQVSNSSSITEYRVILIYPAKYGG